PTLLVSCPAPPTEVHCWHRAALTQTLPPTGIFQTHQSHPPVRTAIDKVPTTAMHTRPEAATQTRARRARENAWMILHAVRPTILKIIGYEAVPGSEEEDASRNHYSWKRQFAIHPDEFLRFARNDAIMKSKLGEFLAPGFEPYMSTVSRQEAPRDILTLLLHTLSPGYSTMTPDWSIELEEEYDRRQVLISKAWEALLWMRDRPVGEVVEALGWPRRGNETRRVDVEVFVGVGMYLIAGPTNGLPASLMRDL
ncbi:hypothetical protein DFH27DRAFT_386568, partial [Peziza echinospora]